MNNRTRHASKREKDPTAGLHIVLLAALCFLANPGTGLTKNAEPVQIKGNDEFAESKSEKLFLDRLMMVESGGNNLAKNPRSSALGPFQFIRSTFFEVMHKYFPTEVDGKNYAQIQNLRIDPKIARRAALAYTRENAVYLSDKGISPEPGYLRLAFLVGPGGAARVIEAKPKTLVSAVLSSSAIGANPFLRGMTTKQLIERSNREAAGLSVLPLHALKKRASPHPEIKVRCNLRRPSCRRWLHLAKKRLRRKKARELARQNKKK